MPRLSKIGAAALAAFGWTSGAAGVTASYLVVAGGGGGGGGTGGGGGAGGFLSNTTTLTIGTTYTIIVGSGGAGGNSGVAQAVSGSNSSAFSVTAIGGGYGGNGGTSGFSGGSGGGGGNSLGSNGGAGTSGQGNAGGNGNNGSGGGGSGVGFNAGGGGGAGAAGTNGTTTATGNGGNGLASSITGSSVTYAGGGGAGSDTFRGITSGGIAGTGGGGTGATTASTAGGNGTANTGGGGGGGSNVNTSGTGGNGAGGNGGSGIVIISYPGAQQFGGGVVTSVGGNTIHTFTTSGTLSPLSSLTASYLIVAGGGGGGATNGGGGGGGGMLTGSGLTIDTNSVYVVTVGAGGAGAATGANNGVQGGNSSFSIVSTSAVGGGRGAGSLGNAGGNGGSGGGGSAASGVNYSGGSPTSGQGFAGGTSGTDAATYNGSGGGGGAGGVGQNGSNTNSRGGAGGTGATSSISGVSVTYAGGGGGGANGDVSTPSPQGTGGAGGAGGGGNGATGLGYLTTNNAPSGTGGTAGTANLGGGGGGGGSNGLGSAYFGFAGGSGIVIISYPGSTPQMAGGTVTAAGGNIIHTFTSSGYLTPITNLNNSLRFRSSASAYLRRTPTVSGNRRTWTFSAWVKRGSLATGAQQALLSVSDGTSFPVTGILLTDANRLRIASGTASVSDIELSSTQVFRDPSAWYHFVIAIDTTQATSTNRVRAWVNGVQVVLDIDNILPAQNYETMVNNTGFTHNIGAQSLNGLQRYFDGYMADINLIDGQALTPSSFGAFNGQGVWQPVRYGGSYGTNGFYLPFNSGSETFTASFNGSSQYLNLGGQSNFAFGTGDFTVEFWLYPTSFTNLQLVYDSRPNGVNGVYPSIYVEASTGIIYYYSDSTNRITGNALRLNSWSHIALSRSSGSTRLFVNGIQVGSTYADSENLLNGASRPTIGASGNNTGAFPVVGSISNLRVVKGTAVYTSNFVPSTTPLTAITNTQLLTLQNATIVDNSTNAFSITNNGTVTTVPGKPLSTAVFQDQSPQGNNWTPNNISGASGSTLDYMTDVPTNTSATVANYCTLNPIGNPNVPITTYSAGNLQFSNPASSGNAPKMSTQGTMGVSSGKWYYEFTGGSSGNTFAGFSTAIVSGSARGSAYFSYINSGGTSVSAGISVTGTPASFTTNDVIGLAFDIDAGTATLYKNGVSQATLSSIPAGTWFSYTEVSSSGSASDGIVNFGQQPFRYTPPAGFVALNTFNLPTPTIGATPATTANKYFDATLYTGTGSAQSITNSGSMQPDLVWVKGRNAAKNHTLVDSVRGATKNLVSNSTNDEGTWSSVTAFNSNGFTLGTDSNENGNTNTFVAWQWRASNATAVTNTAGTITSSVSANTTAGFSIVTYTGTGVSNATVGHGLGVAPSMVILKSRTTNSTSNNWWVYHSGLSANNVLYLNTTDAQFAISSTTSGGVGSVSSSIFTLVNGVTNNNNTNQTSGNYVAYCFAQIAGYSAFGSYTGNGSTDGPFIYTGFRPRFIMWKKTNTSTNAPWVIVDTSRSPYNLAREYLLPNSADAETSVDLIDILSNGYKWRGTAPGGNANGDTYIYAAFAENPFKYANAR